METTLQFIFFFQACISSDKREVDKNAKGLKMPTDKKLGNPKILREEYLVTWWLVWGCMVGCPHKYCRKNIW